MSEAFCFFDIKKCTKTPINVIVHFFAFVKNVLR